MSDTEKELIDITPPRVSPPAPKLEEFEMGEQDTATRPETTDFEPSTEPVRLIVLDPETRQPIDPELL